MPTFGPDPVVEVYKRDVDRSLLRENLRMTIEERIRQHDRVARMAAELQKAKSK